MKNNKFIIMAVVAFACAVMGVVDAVIMPGYFVKSIIKIAVFLILPIIYATFDKKTDLKALFVPDKKGFSVAIICGVGVFAAVLGAFLIFRNVFDFSALTSSLTVTTGVSKSNFIFVALYISFCNSLLEEFFFRGFSFLNLKRVSSRKTAYIFSSLMFAVYHIAMMIGWFSLPVVLLSMAGLFAGGIIFNFFNERYNNIYISWLIHMFANFATNAIGFILFAE